jgi:glycosyltransferase involved in cell wall biosynthesis
MPSDKPLISVVLCVHNVRPYVGEAVDSILGQTQGDFELLLYDDGSTDGTRDILQSLAERDDRIDLQLRDKGNYVANLIDGVRRARGEFLARHDGDDVSRRDRFERQVALLREQPEVVCVGSRMTETDPFGVELCETDHEPDHETIDASFLQGNGWAVPQPAAMMRTDAVRRVGSYRTEAASAEDIDLFLRLADIGRFANVMEPLVRYRRHATSVNSTRGAEQRRVVWQAVRDARQRRGHLDPDAGGYASLDVAQMAMLPPDEALRRWGWNALRRGEPLVARRHARSLLRRRPMRWSSWKLAACAWRGR